MKCLLALAVALLIASGFGVLIGTAGARGAAGNMLVLGMFVAIYFACRRQGRNKRCPLCLGRHKREQRIIQGNLESLNCHESLPLQ